MAKSLSKSLPIKNSGFFDKVYLVVKKIPKGKVETYGQIAEILGTKDARKVGWALHANKDSNIPCHRVVNKDGRLALGYAFGGPNEQKMKLEAGGMGFKGGSYVNLQKFLWNSVE